MPPPLEIQETAPGQLEFRIFNCEFKLTGGRHRDGRARRILDPVDPTMARLRPAEVSDRRRLRRAKDADGSVA
jgi:hypothetical protein